MSAKSLALAALMLAAPMLAGCAPQARGLKTNPGGGRCCPASTPPPPAAEPEAPHTADLPLPAQLRELPADRFGTPTVPA